MVVDHRSQKSRRVTHVMSGSRGHRSWKVSNVIRSEVVPGQRSRQVTEVMVVDHTGRKSHERSHVDICDQLHVVMMYDALG